MGALLPGVVAWLVVPGVLVAGLVGTWPGENGPTGRGLVVLAVSLAWVVGAVAYLVGGAG